MKRRTVEESDRKLKKIIRKVSEEDLKQQEENKKLEQEAKVYCLERIMARGLPMKLISTEATLDKKRIIFYFTAEKRIDFRELVKDLGLTFQDTDRDAPDRGKGRRQDNRQFRRLREGTLLRKVSHSL